jgi:hypothetical protein
MVAVVGRLLEPESERLDEGLGGCRRLVRCVVMSFKLAHRDDCQTVGNWRLVRRTLELGAFGINVVEISPGEQIPEHDETDRDQEEVFYVLSGSPTLVIDGESIPCVLGRSRGSIPSTGAPCATTARSRRACSSSPRQGRAGMSQWTGHE